MFCDFQTVFFRKEVLLSYQTSNKKFLPHSPPAVFHLPVKSFISQRLEIYRNTLFTLIFEGFKFLTSSDGYHYFFCENEVMGGKGKNFAQKNLLANDFFL